MRGIDYEAFRNSISSNYLSGNACHLRICTGFPEGFGGLHAGDYATALQEWRPLAEQGNADAQYNLGVMYDNGQGVPQDYAEAVKWYRLAAEQGYATHNTILGLCTKMAKAFHKTMQKR